MILTGKEIFKEVINDKITILPFNESQLNPNSYNFRLGKYLKKYKNYILDPKVKQETEEIIIPDDGYVITPGRIYLGHTQEVLGSNYYVPLIKGRSSTARLGLFVHITADIVDIGSISQLTLQLYPVQPIKIFPGMLIGQITFWKVFGDIDLYNGKYQGARGPCESKIYKDFE